MSSAARAVAEVASTTTAGVRKAAGSTGGQRASLPRCWALLLLVGTGAACSTPVSAAEGHAGVPPTAGGQAQQTKAQRAEALPQAVQQRFDAAVAAYQRGDHAEAVRLQQGVVEWARTNLTPTDAALGSALSNLSAFQSLVGRNREALATGTEAVAVYRRRAATDPAAREDLARTLLNLANFHGEVGENQQALLLSTETVALWRDLAKVNPAFRNKLADALNDRSTYLNALERLQEALATAREAAALQRQLTAGQADPGMGLGLALLNVGGIASRLGLVQEALTVDREAVAILRQLVRSDPGARPELATALSNLGTALSEMGRPEEALVVTREAVALLRELPLRSPAARAELADNLSDLGIRHHELGQLAEALRHAQESVTLFRELAAADPRQQGALAFALSNLAARFDALGRQQEAMGSQQEAVRLLEPLVRSDPTRQGSLGTTLGNLGAFQINLGRNGEAIATLVRAVDLLRARVQERPSLLPDLANAISNLGIAYAGTQQKQQALTAAQMAVRMHRQLAAANRGARDELPGVLNNLANRLSALGRVPEALTTLQEGLVIQRELARTHAAALSNLGQLAMNGALLQLRRGDQGAAVTLLEEMVRSDVLVLQRQLPLLPERRRQALVQNQGLRWQIPFSLANQGVGGARLALFTRLNRQGLLQDIQRRQAQLVRSSSLRALADQLNALASQLANMALPQAQRQGLETRREQLEQDLYRRLPDLQAQLVQPAEVASLLPANSRLVEFQRYRPHDPGELSWERSFGAPRYLALVLRSDGRVASTDLGPAAAIDAAVGEALNASAGNLADAPRLWAAVGRLVLEPLRSELSGSRELFFSPDGELNRVPFSALPSLDTPDRLLGEAVRLRLLTSGRDLLRLQRPTRPGGAALVIADPRFDRRAGAAGGAMPGPARGGSGGQRRSNALSSTQIWSPLPGTAAEARQVAPLLRVPAPITGQAATAAFILETRAPRVLHIATHGFFLPDQPQVFLPPGSGPAASRATASGPAAPEDPLLRSGLALAGANQPEADPSDDGYLTAAEVTGIDLDGTELVTLSACETGLGDVRSGEGVYGLQRALTVAGSRSTLLSLWKVDDVATAAFMADFYTRLKAGEGRADALRNTQSFFRSHTNPLFRDIAVWAAFQLTGDWRPITTR